MAAFEVKADDIMLLVFPPELDKELDLTVDTEVPIIFYTSQRLSKCLQMILYQSGFSQIVIFNSTNGVMIRSEKVLLLIAFYYIKAVIINVMHI